MTEKANILLVDDKPDKLLALEVVLSDLGENLVRATSGREALRQLLAREFAVILLDVNMPGMDGFETASLIRQRVSSRDVPIIFITAFADEMHVARGYSIGAVDYILAPVVPEVLRTKVKVFVDLYHQKRLLGAQAQGLRRRADQLQRLAGAALAINGSRSLLELLRTVADAGREIIGCHQTITLYVPEDTPEQGATRVEAVGSFSDRYADWRDRPLRLSACARTEVARGHRTVRMTEAELKRHPDWPIVRELDVPPIRGMVAAPLTAGERSFGLVYVSERCDGGEFTVDDEAILTQLAQMASIAIENTLFAEEREANRVKDEFLATLSHELRTPLNAILGWTQLLRAAPASEDDVSHGLEVIERNVKAQTRLIEDLLDMSRITSGKLRLAVRPVSLAAVVDGAVESSRPAAAAKNIRLESHVATDVGEIAGDPDRLQQVVWNLISNAIKFTPAGGRVRAEVEAHRAEGRIRIRVTDSGKGIHPAFLPYVFDRFRQADSSTTRAHGGLGLGLTIVRHLVELHGGTVHAESRGEGHGATFTVDLPVAAPAPAVAAVPASPHGEPLRSDPGAAAPGNRNGVPSGTGAAASQGGVGAAAAAEFVPDLEQLHVLAVDDEPDTRELIRHLLERSGARVTTAGSAREALDLLDQHSPDILVSDIGMPEDDGYALIRQVRGREPQRGGGVPAIALTAYVREEDRTRMLAAGFTAHVPKPVEAHELVRTVGLLCGRLPGARDHRGRRALHLS